MEKEKRKPFETHKYNNHSTILTDFQSTDLCDSLFLSFFVPEPPTSNMLRSIRLTDAWCQAAPGSCTGEVHSFEKTAFPGQDLMALDPFGMSASCCFIHFI